MSPQVMEFLQSNWALFAVLAAIAAAFMFARFGVGYRELPYEKRAALVTETERKFYRALAAAVGGSWSVFAMVRLADILKVRKHTAGYTTWLNKITCKHIDFVICENDTLDILLAIELDDSSHERKDRIERDEFINSAFSAAGLKLWRVTPADTYDKVAIRKRIDEILGVRKRKDRE